MDLDDHDKDMMKELGHFLKKVNEQALFHRGLVDTYEGVDRDGLRIAALDHDIEYYHPTITLDERMNNIARYIVCADASDTNIVCNTIVSHFYGPTDIHLTLTGNEDRATALIDFDRIAGGDVGYTEEMRDRAKEARKSGKQLYNPLELRTSLWDAAKKFMAKKTGIEGRALEPFDLCEWVASFVTDGTAIDMLNSRTLDEVYGVMTRHRGIGSFYGYHCGTSNSVNPKVAFHHDEPFIMPGPGAKKAVKAIWKGKVPESRAADAVRYIRENQERLGLTDGVYFHPQTWNIVDQRGRTVFSEPQNGLKYYGTEVLLCQFSCYLRLKENPASADKRRIKSMAKPAVEESVWE